MKKLLFSILTLVFFSAPVFAATTKKGPACTTRNLYDEFMKSIYEKDENAFTYLMNNGCIIIKEGFPVTILDRGGMLDSVAKVRVYTSGTGLVLFMDRKNIENFYEIK